MHGDGRVPANAEAHVSPQIRVGTPGADSTRERRTLRSECRADFSMGRAVARRIEDPAKRVDLGRVAHLSGLRMVSGSRVNPTSHVVAGLVRGFRSARNFSDARVTGSLRFRDRAHLRSRTYPRVLRIVHTGTFRLPHARLTNLTHVVPLQARAASKSHVLK